MYHEKEVQVVTVNVIKSDSKWYIYVGSSKSLGFRGQKSRVKCTELTLLTPPIPMTTTKKKKCTAKASPIFSANNRVFDIDFTKHIDIVESKDVFYAKMENLQEKAIVTGA